MILLFKLLLKISEDTKGGFGHALVHGLLEHGVRISNCMSVSRF